MFTRVSKNSGSLQPSPKSEQAYEAWITFLGKLFQTHSKRGIFLEKVQTFLKPFFIEFYYNLTADLQDLFCKASFYEAYPEKVHSLFVTYLKNLDNVTGGRPELDDTNLRVLHHIVPRFEDGSDELDNRVMLHQYEHALIHLFRYSWKKMIRDLNAFSSACLTNEQLERRNTSLTGKTLEARLKTTLNPEWQKTVAAKGRENRGTPVISPLQRRKAAETGGKTQWRNARKRVQPFTWYLCEQSLAFQNVKDPQVVWMLPDDNPEKRTVASIAEKLTQHPIHVKTKSPTVSKNLLSNLAMIFRGERNVKWGWSFYAISIDGYTHSLRGTVALLTLKRAFATVFLSFYGQAAEQPDLKPRFLNRLESSFERSFLEVFFENVKTFSKTYEELVPYGSSNQELIKDLEDFRESL